MPAAVVIAIYSLWKLQRLFKPFVMSVVAWGFWWHAIRSEYKNYKYDG